MTGRCVIMLGMHRSGTSALAGTLQQAGVFLGDVGQQNVGNAKGNREPALINVLHEELLAANGGTWDRPVVPLKWERIHRMGRDLFIGQFRNEALWGFKDPRTLLALGGWLNVLPDADLVGIFRHPFAVAHSLHRRDNMTIEDALALWTSYNRALLWWGDQRPELHLIEFDDDQLVLEASLQSLIRVLELPNTNIDFFDPSLRQSTPPDPGPSSERDQALVLYDKLRMKVRALNGTP